MPGLAVFLTAGLAAVAGGPSSLGAGIEAPTCDGRIATISGTDGRDRIIGTARADVIVAGEGDDRIEGGAGADVICAGPGDDGAGGGTEPDRIFGEGGADELLGEDGEDTLDGGAQADWCRDGEEERRCHLERPLDIVPGGTETTGKPKGKLYRYAVIVERGIAIDDQRVAEIIDATLAHDRGWTASGAVRVRRVDDPAKASARIYLTTPETTDELCYPLITRGLVSCSIEDRVVLNILRWRTGFDGWTSSIANYRRYLINHEFGHRLGRGHEPCSVPGAKAAVMQQQTFDLQNCRPGWWPLPFELRELAEDD